MKAQEVSLFKEKDQSFTFYHEKNPFTRWHYHVELELVYVVKGSGKRMIGDSIERFEKGDLVFLGPNLPHEWLCDASFYDKVNGFKGEAIVIQFHENFLGEGFFGLHENKRMAKVIQESKQGLRIMGAEQKEISAIMDKMKKMDDGDKLYALFSIFKSLCHLKNFELLASPGFTNTFQADQGSSLKKVISYIMKNFQKKIHLKEILDIANMSSTTFSVVFKKNYHLTFSEYVLKVRIGYACNLLTDNSRSISQVSLDSGFDNLSNFNRLFKKSKGITPKEFRKKAMESEGFGSFYEEA